MLKNIIIVALAVVNGTLIYGFFLRSPDALTAPQVASPVVITHPVPAPPAPVDNAPDQTPTAAELTGDHGYGELADLLHDRGIPEDLVRQMVLAAFDSDYLSQQQQNSLDTPYWKKPERDPYQDVMARLDFEESKRALLIRIFGDDVVDDPFFEDLFKPMNSDLSFLTSDKQIALDNLIRSNRAINSAARGEGFIRETRDELRANSEDLSRAIQELLSDEEHFEYLLRESSLANNLVRTMDGLDYSEQEFRDIYDIRSSLNTDAIRQAGGSRSAFIEARKENDARIRDYLGDNRYDEFRRLQDPAFRSLLSIGERYGTTDADLIAVYEITTNTNQQIQEVARSRGLSKQESNSKINDLRSVAQTEIEQIVGEEVAASVRQNTSRYSRGRR